MDITTIQKYLALIAAILQLWQQFFVQPTPVASAKAGDTPETPQQALARVLGEIGAQARPDLSADQQIQHGATIAATMMSVLLSGK